MNLHEEGWQVEGCEPIPERIVHARGPVAHGNFETYQPLTEFTRAAPFQAAGKIKPVFTRFSTAARETLNPRPQTGH